MALAVGVVLALGLAAINWWPSASAPALSARWFAVPSAYSVTYAVTTAGSSPTTERLWVRRPFDSVDITYAGATP
ncbi:MAG TPA: hypothetical protein VKJ07_18755, partial [Mycobacteriales bacterium]|nr:hypothetical protein [Mycobacteriales bacterium]